MKKTFYFLAVLFTATFTNAQGVMVKDINTTGNSMANYNITRISYNNNLFFGADDGANGMQLWKSDGTASGTFLFKNMRSGNNDANPHDFIFFPNTNKLYFTAPYYNNSIYYEPWISDGTASGTEKLVKISTTFNSGSTPYFYTLFNNKIYFSAIKTDGRELHAMDGTLNNDTVIKDIRPGASSSTPEELTVFNTNLYFSADDGTNGRELWISDGTTTGTILLANINSGANPSQPKEFTSFNNKLYFSANDGTNGRELWVTDGTTAGTTLVSDINTGANDSQPHDFIVYKNELYFTAFTTATGNELFKVDTNGNVVNVIDINPGASGHGNPTDFFIFNNKLFYSADNGTDGVELWYTEVSSGSARGVLGTTTAMVKNINPSGNSNPTGFILYDGKFYFNADDGTNGKELWVSDGTVAGTTLAQDINPSGSGNPRDFIISNNLLYFSADDGTNGEELWKYSNLPIVGKFEPADDASSAALDNKLKLIFNKNVQKGTGNVFIYNASDDSVVETIDITSSSIVFGGTLVTITPSANFTGGTYYVKIDNTAIKDMNNVNFVGIADKTTWNFTTAAQNQTITFNALPNKMYGDADFELTATTSSGLTVSYTSSDTTVAEIVSGGNTGPDRIKIIGVGTASITASQAGNTAFNAATDVQQTLTVNKANQTINFGTVPAPTYGDADFTLSATTSSGLAVTYSSSDTNVATISGNTVTIVNAGTTTITVSQAGDNNYNAATSVTETLLVSKANQVITFNALPNKTYGDTDFELTATTSSNLPITYTSSDINVAEIVSGANTGPDRIKIIGAGTSTITASQTGNNNYNLATNVTKTLQVNKADRTISFNPPTLIYGNPDFNLSATISGDSGATVNYYASPTSIVTVNNTLTGNTSIIGAGNVNVTVEVLATANYNYKSENFINAFTIAKANQTITFGSISDKVVNTTFNLSATSDSSLPITYASSNTTVATISGNTVTTVALGNITITASQVGNNNYNAATDFTQSFAVTTTAGINNFEKQFSFYPNPINNSFRIKTAITIDKIEIYNTIGQRIKHFEQSQNEYSVKELPKGLYLVQIYTEKGVAIKKIIKI